jgi:hypothetical protein
MTVVRGRQVSPNSSGADIWLDNSRYGVRYVLTPIQGRLAVWSGGGTPGAAECEEAIGGASVATVEPSPGTLVCVATGSDHLAVLRVTEERADGVLLEVGRW